MQNVWRGLLLFVLCTRVALADGAAADPLSLRNQEINECRSNEMVTWGDGRDRPVGSALLQFSYNPKNAPAWFSAAKAGEMVAKAAEAWSQCGIPTQMIPWNSALEKQRNIVVIKWDEQDSRGNFGLANFTRRTLALGPKPFTLLNKVNPAYNSQTLQMVISHEMGHLFGLMAHSKRCIDVLSYYDNGKGDVCSSRDPLWKSRMVEYRSTLPTACDIQRCRAANNKPPA